MEEPKRFAARITHDCGQKLEIPVAQLEEDFQCPGCGKTDRISVAGLAQIRSKLGQTLMEADRRRTETGADATAEWDFHEGGFVEG